MGCYDRPSYKSFRPDVPDRSTGFGYTGREEHGMEAAELREPEGKGGMWQMEARIRRLGRDLFAILQETHLLAVAEDCNSHWRLKGCEVGNENHRSAAHSKRRLF